LIGSRQTLLRIRLLLRLEPKTLTPTPAPAPAQNANSGRSPLRHSGSVIISGPDPILFVQNVLNPAGIKSWNSDPVHLCVIVVLHRGEQILIFQLLIHIQKNFCISVSNPYPKISEIWYPISICIRMQHWLNTKQTGSGYKSANVPSFLKTDSSVTCNMTLIHYKCAVDCTTLGKNAVNLTFYT